MKFTYTYRSSDGQRRTAEIEAENRDAAFERVRAELGIKPIKVVAAVEESGKSAASPNSSARTQQSGAGGSRSRATVWGVAILAAAGLAGVGGVLWFTARQAAVEERAAAEGRPDQADDSESRPEKLESRPEKSDDMAKRQETPNAAPYQVMTPQGPVTLSIADPLPRQMIPGNRQRIENANRIFSNAAEAWLARFAEPGRRPPATGGTPVAPDAAKMAAPHAGDAPAGALDRDGSPSRPSPADFEAALRVPIRIASTDFTEVVDLKRIVTGMKREMRAYLAGGGMVEQYLAELEKRQKLEVSYRERAEQKLNDMLNGQDVRSPSGRDSLKAAYAYWLKANAQLQAMGIYPLVLPDALRSYQMSLDIEE